VTRHHVFCFFRSAPRSIAQLLSHLIDVVDGTVEKARRIERKSLTSVVRIVRATQSRAGCAASGLQKTKKAAAPPFLPG
jgi:hypothetical protein